MSHSIERRQLLKLLTGASALVLGSGLLTACNDDTEKDKNGSDATDGPATPGEPLQKLKPVKLSDEKVAFTFGPSEEEMPLEPDGSLGEGMKPETREEMFVVNGSFEIDDHPFLAGAATILFPDESRAEITIEDGYINVGYRETTLAISQAYGMYIMVNGEKTDRELVFKQLRKEFSMEGVAALSDQSRAMVAFSVLFQAPAIVANTEIARAMALEIDWCYVIAKAGSIALYGLGAAACFALLAGCAGGTVVLPGIGAVSCVVAAGLCGAINAGLQALLEAITAVLWNEPDVNVSA